MTIARWNAKARSFHRGLSSCLNGRSWLECDPLSPCLSVAPFTSFLICAQFCFCLFIRLLFGQSKLSVSSVCVPTHTTHTNQCLFIPLWPSPRLHSLTSERVCVCVYARWRTNVVYLVEERQMLLYYMNIGPFILAWQTGLNYYTVHWLAPEAK